MSINTEKVSGSGATQAYYQNLNAKRNGGGAAQAANTAVQGDTYSAGSGGPKGVYSKDAASTQKLWEMAEARTASMRGAVESMIGGSSGPNGQTFWATSAASGNGISYAGSFLVDKATQDKAKELISEDGYFGVKKTTERIMDFAKALAGSGADEKTIEKLRGGAKAGFDYVANLFGGFNKLPDVTKDTYDAVMKSFDDWVSGAKVAS
jgi:hypothetical protein